jgi:hypothetical protein
MIMVKLPYGAVVTHKLITHIKAWVIYHESEIYIDTDYDDDNITWCLTFR